MLIGPAMAPPSPTGTLSGRTGHAHARLSDTFAAEVQVDALQPVSIDAAGVLRPQDGGLPERLWAGTSGARVLALLQRLPATTSSPTVRDLMRRLLLTAAAPPGDTGPRGAFIDERVAALWRMADVDGVIKLASLVPADVRSPRLARVQADAHLLKGDVGPACDEAGARAGGGLDPFWLELSGFCQALRGERDQAELTLALLTEREPERDVYRALLAAAIGVGSKLPDVADPTALDLAMLRKAHRSPAPAATRTDSLPILAGIATSPDASTGLRVAAAERAVAAGALPAERLYVLPITAAKPAADKPRTVMALIREARDTPPGSAQQLQAVIEALAAGQESGDYLAAARLAAPVLAAASPEAEPPERALAIVPALLVTGQTARADAWLERLQHDAATKPAAARVLTTLLPLATIAGLDGARDWKVVDLMTSWPHTEGTHSARARTGQLLTVLRAVGYTTPDSLWSELLLIPGAAREHRDGLDPVFRNEIARAAAAGRIGETVLLTIVAMGPQGSQGLDSAGLELVLSSLRRVGLDRDAHGLAIEALAAA